MTELLLAPFQYDYMLRAMLVSGFIGAVCALLSCFVTLKGWSLMGDALSHAVVPGVSIAFLLHLPFAVGAFASGMLAALTMNFIKSRTRLREDAVIGLVFTTFLALGVLLISLYPSNISLTTIILGNVLGIADEDILQIVIIAAVTLAVLLLKWKDLLLFTFDPHQARAVGLNTDLLGLLLLTLLAATAVAALQAVGAILVIAMLVTPGATAYLLTDRFGRMMAISSGIGLLTSIVGAWASFFLNTSTGGCIVLLQTILFLLVFFFAPKYGFVPIRRQTRRSTKSIPVTRARVPESHPH